MVTIGRKSDFLVEELCALCFVIGAARARCLFSFLEAGLGLEQRFDLYAVLLLLLCCFHRFLVGLV